MALHRVLALLAAILLVAVPGPGPARGQDAPDGIAPGTAEETATPPPRVIVRVNRKREVPGYLELEDDDVVVVRRLDGELESFTTARILGVVRLVDPLPEQRGTVFLRNGQRSQGIVLRDDFDAVEVKVQGIPVEFRREDVDFVVLEPTFRQQYERFKAGLDPNHVEAHLDLCRWLVGERRYPLALVELEALLDAHPDTADARNLRRLVEAQIALEAGTLEPVRTRRPPGQPGPDEPDRGPVRDEDLIPDRILSHEDVNIIRVYEIDLERPPAVSVSPDTIRTLLEEYGSSKLIPTGAERRNALFRADPIEIVRLMFAVRARELYPRIDVLTEPYALNLFRRRVHNTWLMNGCATSRCHGGPDAGRFVLHRRGGRDARVWLTNLLILERLELDPSWPLIDYDAPIDSLIVQHGLPRHLARRPHPDVRGWSPVFSRTNERMLEQTVKWINAMMKPRPEYPVDYEPPRLGDGPVGDAPGRPPR